MVATQVRLRQPEIFPGAALATRCDAAFVHLERRTGIDLGPQAFAPAGSSGVDADSLLWLGCISKTFVATAVMMLVERRLMALDDPVGRILSGVSHRIGALTIAQLLTHTSGLPRNMPGWTSSSFFDPAWLAEPLESIVESLPDCVQPTGGARLYSSVGYAVLGRVVEAAVAMEFGAFVAREIFAPLGMSDSCCVNAIPPSLAARVAPVLVRSGGRVTTAFEARNTTAIRNSMPFAGFFSTATDLARFTRMFVGRGETLLGEETVARMLQEAVVGQGIHQGMAWFLAFDGRERPGEPSRVCGFWHTSSSGSLVAANVDEESAVVILGQPLLEEDLVPVRVAEWTYVERTLHMQPRASAAMRNAETPQWLHELTQARPSARQTHGV